MQETAISWADYTWNPTHGCSKVSEGCANCYAERISLQYGHTSKEWTNEHAHENVSLRPGKLDEPETELSEPATIFVNSMSDLFHDEVPSDYIQKVFRVMRNHPHHVFQVLTKRPERAATIPIDWPPNVWLGTSVENERVTDRIDHLCDSKAETRFVSFEPLIGPVGDVDLEHVDWAIVGGESGPDDVRREMDHEWARDIKRQCREDDVAFFFKQSSARRQGSNPYLAEDRGGVMVGVEYREMPDVHPMVDAARDAWGED